ncbi:MAG: MarR family transcriptional regulator [Actinomycetota bacterium]|nr:MarR family transcriptional regulator [Actinomycetota bacterium]
MEFRSVLDVATVRPGTAAYADRHQAAMFRENTFQPTAGDAMRLRVLNLEGGFFELGVMDEMLMPVARGIPNGSYGDMSLVVVTSDDTVADYVRYIASRNQAPLWLSDSLHDFADRAQPAGSLTEAERDTLREVQQIGAGVTAAGLAEALGIEPNAAANRLANLERKGYVFRHERSKRDGDLFVIPIQVKAPSRIDAALPVSFEIPLEIRNEVVHLAANQGMTPLQLVTDAWRAYAEQNAQAMRAERRRLTELLETGDDDAYLAEALPDLDEQAAEIAKGQRERR